MMYLLAVVLGLIVGAVMMRSFIRAGMRNFAAKRIQTIENIVNTTVSDHRGAEYLKYELLGEAAAWRAMFEVRS